MIGTEDNMSTTCTNMKNTHTHTVQRPFEAADIKKAELADIGQNY